MAYTPEKVRARVADYIREHPELTYQQIADKLHCSVSALYAVAKDHGVSRKPRKLTASAVEKLEAANG